MGLKLNQIMNYWNDQRWKSIHNGAKTVSWFFTGDKLTLAPKQNWFLIYEKNWLLIFDWQRKLKSKIELEYAN